MSHMSHKCPIIVGFTKLLFPCISFKTWMAHLARLWPHYDLMSRCRLFSDMSRLRAPFSAEFPEEPFEPFVMPFLLNLCSRRIWRISGVFYESWLTLRKDFTGFYHPFCIGTIRTFMARSSVTISFI